MLYRVILSKLLLCSAVVAVVALPARAQKTPGSTAAVAATPNQVRGDEITAEQQAAVARGLEFLASRQAPDGSLGPPGITALGGLAFMENGNLPGRGKYGDNVKKCLDFVLANCQESGLIASNADGGGPMYGHGFATLFLAEVYGMSPTDDVKERLQRAVRLIEKCQNPEGGWRYQPAPVDADISVTICQVMALRAARDAGIKVEKDVIDKAIAYVRSCQNPDGGFSYMSHGATGSGFARSAAGVASLYYAGVFEGDELKRGLDYLKRFANGGAGATGFEGHFYYGNYYAVQAMFLAGGNYWKTFYPAIRDQLIARQDRSSGGFAGDYSPEYATAMAMIILQMPNRYLPVYNGKGPGE